MKYKAIIRVVKSLNNDNSYGCCEAARIPVIEAESKQEVKQIVLERFPQFFQNGKVYEKETKDPVQFFYVVIYPLFNFEVEQIEKGEWKCSYCGQVHENMYVSKPRINERLLGSELMFCLSEDDYCLNKYLAEKYKNIGMPDDLSYVKADSPIYIYKITEKASNKSYIGKTRNAPFFRWWNHLTHSYSPFGVYLRSTKLSDWTFEVLSELPSFTSDTDVFKLESEYIVSYDSINNGYNTLISNKSVYDDNDNTIDDNG